jgi:hypothetical protein
MMAVSPAARWTGPPLGYAAQDHKLIVIDSEAETVRHIFRRYAAFGSVRLLKDELDAADVRSKSWASGAGRRWGGKPLARGALYLMLQNRIYRGEIAHKGQHYPGEHEPIVDQALWDAIQTKLAANTVERRSGGTARSPSLLAGLLFDSEGHRMTPSHAVKRGTRYRYYISRPLISTGRGTAPEALRIPAGEIEQLVVARLRQLFSEPARVAEATMAEVETAVQQRHLQQRAAALAANWPELTVTQRRLMLTAFIKRIVVGIDRVDIQLSPSRLTAVLRLVTPGPIPTDFADQSEQPILLSIPAQFRRAGLGIRMLIDEAGSPMRAAKADPKLIKLIARAHMFSHRLAESSGEHLDQIAKGLGVTRSYLTRVLRLTYLAPDITRAILEGRHARDLTAQKLLSHSRLPLSWPEQRQILGFA